MLDRSLKDALFACEILVQEKISYFLPEDFSDSKLVEAMRYSSMSGGKRLRPFLVIVIAQIFGVKPVHALNAAVAVEFIHNYSLIHDDLPAMDNDDFRRGQPTCHKKFDEATAILAGDALLTLAFEVMSDPATHNDPATRCELIQTLAKASGFNGMVGGQMIDLENADKEISKEELVKLHRLKTGELFVASAEIGAILGGASAEDRKSMRYFAHDLGLAFQIKDDILDHYHIKSGKVEIDEAVHKKPQENASIVDLMGLENAKNQLKILKEQAVQHLKPFGEKSSLLLELAEFVATRER